MNHNYARIVNPQKLEYAPDALESGGGLQLAPTTEDYAAAGWLPVLPLAPAPAEGWHVASREWRQEGGEIAPVYRYEEDPPRNLELSKRKLMNNLRDIGMWDAVKKWMCTSGRWDDWASATTLEEQDPMMQAAIAALPAVGISAEAIESLLTNSEV